MLSLILEVLASVVSTSEPTHVIRDFTDAITVLNPSCSVERTHNKLLNESSIFCVRQGCQNQTCMSPMRLPAVSLLASRERM